MSEEPKLHNHHHEVGGERSSQGAEPAFDAASQSLTNALRLSFRVLTLVIVVLAVLFVSRGFFTVQSDQKVIIERFGKCDVSLVKDQGWHYAFPYPVDKVIPVWVRLKTMDINVFWPKPSQEAKEQAVTKGKEDLNNFPGADDGVVLTGDMNMMQGRLQAIYSIRGGTAAAAEDVVKYYLNVGDEANEEKLIRGLVQNAFIVALSNKPVADVYTMGTADARDRDKARLMQLSEDVQSLVQKMVQNMGVGLEVRSVSVVTIQPPAQAKQSFDAAFSAYAGATTAVKEADRARNKILIDAAGAKGIELGNTIAARWDAYTKGDAAAVAEADKKISTLLENAQGEVAGVMAEARIYRTTVVSEAAADSATIAKLTADTSAAGQASLKVFLEEMRVEAIEEVLKSAYEKYFFNPNQQERTTLELWLNRRTEIRRAETIVEQQR